MLDFSYDPTRLGQVALTALVAYAALVILLRLSGKRTLTDLNVFDFVVTVALGSVLATTILSPDVPLLAGLVALAVLIVCQAVVALLTSRSDAVRDAVKAEPTLVVHNGAFLRDAMKRVRLSEPAVLAAIRGAGEADVADVHAVVLETNGELSVIPDAPSCNGKAVAPARTAG